MKTLFAILTAMLMLTAVVFAQGSTSTVNQTGDQNVATVDQTGSGHNANVDQFGRNHAEVDQYGGNNNSAAVTQGSSGSPVNNYYQPNYPGDWINGAFIEQVGSDNTAAINMSRSSNGSSIYQEGDGNEGYQDLGSTQHKTTNWNRMGLDIDQVGDNNYANQKTVASFGVYGIQGMVIDQEGDNNVANQYSKGGAYATMEIYQDGDNNNNPAQSGNTFDLSATGTADPLNLPWADKPAGDFTQYQNAYRGTAHMSVTGDGNNTAQYQEYTVWAAGGDNDAYMDITGNTNNAAQGQLGEYNDADMDISGDNNIAAQSQHGDSNSAVMNILGSFNVSGMEQVGDGHSATTNQTGNNNSATVIQN